MTPTKKYQSAQHKKRWHDANKAENTTKPVHKYETGESVPFLLKCSFNTRYSP